MKQIIFKDLENNTLHAGFLDEEGNIYCACCGEKFAKSEEGQYFEIVKVSDEWTDIQVEIVSSNEALYSYVEKQKEQNQQ